MPATRVDLAVRSRWMLPMTSTSEVLENHTLIAHDGRILDLLPAREAAVRYAPTAQVDRPTHVVLPGFVDAFTRIAPPPAMTVPTDQLQTAAQIAIAALLKSGTTCFLSSGSHPDVAARAAAEQGLRAVIGMPVAQVADTDSPDFGDGLTRALALRDEYRTHPRITSVFAPAGHTRISDPGLARIAMLADELDAGILLELHESAHEIAASLARHGIRPIERLRSLGLLTPALIAVHMVHANAEDIDQAKAAGIAVILSPASNARRGNGPTPVAAWRASGLRIGLGCGGGDNAAGLDIWSELRAFAAEGPVAGRAMSALAAATRGGAAALGLDAELGSLERGKWADLCSIDLSGPALAWNSPITSDPATALACHGGRDLICDVWVGARHLLNDGAFTRIDWRDLYSRMQSWRKPTTIGDTE